MPYPRAQATAIFLDIKRKKGLKKAKAFGEKHREDFRKTSYTAKGRR